ncbi:hypothetical protein DB31_1562 [Hyalangium minutum]|uniref:Uncharacterized protein n=1 Tax=Hyalangium minutum TaxID=394096 RepID=A0A085WCN3_9BACT|nr:hypothetical protein DB31_1562 [Hyalangium minutum]
MIPYCLTSGPARGDPFERLGRGQGGRRSLHLMCIWRSAPTGDNLRASWHRPWKSWIRWRTCARAWMGAVHRSPPRPPNPHRRWLLPRYLRVRRLRPLPPPFPRGVSPVWPTH